MTAVPEARRSVLRQAVFALISIATGILLVAALVSRSHIALQESLREFRGISITSLLVMVCFVAISSFLSSQKWRLIDAVLQKDKDSALSKITAFTVTSVGAGLGQVLPLSMSMIIARTLGLYKESRPFARGTLGTVFDQGFDFVIVCLLIPATAITRIYEGGAVLWAGIAISVASASLLAIGRAVFALKTLATRTAAWEARRFPWFQRCSVQLLRSGLLDARLAQKLLALSWCRFLILVLMAGQTTKAIGAGIPLWHLAAAMPFVVASSAISITPGGLGVNEIAFSTALSSFGTPLVAAVRWALANRILVATASVVNAMLAMGAFLTKKTAAGLGWLRESGIEES